MTTTINNEHKKLNVPNSTDRGNVIRNVPALRFPEFTEEWVNVSLKDVADFQKERISSGLLDESTYISTENILQNFQGVQSAISIPANTNVVAYKKNDILLSNIRPYLKKVWFSDKIGGCSADVFVLRSKTCEPKFLYNVIASDKFINYVMSGAKGVKMPRGDKNQMESFSFSIPAVAEQRKISRLFQLLDEKIATQNKIIEDLKKLKSAIIEMEYGNMAKSISHIGDFIEQTSKRNKDSVILNVLSVSNSQGFIQQSEQFENRIVASDDTSNYKIVARNDFAFNPARINVGSIARLTTFERGIVSPMYICFRTKNNLFPEYLDYFFESKRFFAEIQKRLEGSVRQCLSFEGLCNIPLCIPTVEVQQQIGKRLSTLAKEIKLEIDFLELLQRQKRFLLHQMFI